MARSREQILAELRTKGLDQRNSGLPLPVPALRVGVLTSADSDGWNDFRKELERSGLGFDVTCYAIRVQGEGLRRTALAGLSWFAERAGDFDVLCVLRGGGSRSDLSWFDDLDVALAVARHPLKILCGIGHERDRSVLDLISQSEKTPTAVAARLVEHAAQATRMLEDRIRAIGATVRERLGTEHRHLGRRAQTLRSAVHGRITASAAVLDEGARRLTRATEVRMRAERDYLARAVHDLISRQRRCLERQTEDLEHRAAKIRLLDPSKVLQRGYTMVRNRTGEIIKSARGLRPGTTLDVIFRDGTVRTTTENNLETKAP